MRFLRRTGKQTSSTSGPVEDPSEFDGVERSWREGIAQHGWIVVEVPDGPGGEPGFQFTAGLTEHGFAEMIVYSLDPELGASVLNEVARRMLDGERFDDGEVIPGLVEGEYRTQLWEATWLQDPLGAATRLYGEDLRVRQLVIPDLQDRLPWEEDYEHPDLQPVLFVPPNGRGPRRAGPPE